jgi:hypothetical protein
MFRPPGSLAAAQVRQYLEVKIVPTLSRALTEMVHAVSLLMDGAECAYCAVLLGPVIPASNVGAVACSDPDGLRFDPGARRPIYVAVGLAGQEQSRQGQEPGRSRSPDLGPQVH